MISQCAQWKIAMGIEHTWQKLPIEYQLVIKWGVRNTPVKIPLSTVMQSKPAFSTLLSSRMGSTLS